MSGRCKACNKKLTEQELTRKEKRDAAGHITYSDLCSVCNITGTTQGTEDLSTFTLSESYDTFDLSSDS